MLRPFLQPKLHVTPADDALELEADRAADDVMRGIVAVVRPAGSQGPQRVSSGEVETGSRAPVGAAGGAVDAGLERSIDGARGGGRALERDVRSRMEAAFGADFSSVRVHTDDKAAEISRSLSANAFTSGRDIFFGRSQYDPASEGGQRLIAHELAHTVQQGAVAGSTEVQRDFRPARLVHNAHLRNQSDLSKWVGNRLDTGDEIVVDKAVTQLDGKKKPDTFVKAVNQTSATFEPGKHGGATTYIRQSRVGADKAYGTDGLKVDTSLYWPATRKGSPDSRSVRLKWLATIGEYVTIEKSVSDDAATIVWEHGNYKRLKGGALSALDVDEQMQLDTSRLMPHLHDSVKRILLTSTTGKPWSDKLATDDNVNKIILDTGSKALRLSMFKDTTGDVYVSWLKWVTAPDGPFKRIEDGADHVAASIDYWRGQLFPTDPSKVTVKSLKLTGSDLHESGLGVMFVTFNKPAGGHAGYTTAGDHDVVVKPEARSLEKALFGTGPGSLASKVNAAVKITKLDDQLTTYKQDVDARYGTLCERVIGTSGEDLAKTPTTVKVVSQAMKESLVFIMLTGLSDQHKENVLWDDRNRPYMIDADNALKLKFMTPTETHLQSGFTWAVNDKSDETIQAVMKSSKGYETKIMEALKNPTSPEASRVLLMVKQILGGQVGRTVPIETAVWGGRLQSFIACTDPGKPSDAPIPNTQPKTRWQWCNYWAETVPTGKGANAPGLKGEVGVAAGGDGNFKADVEAAQLHADFTVGQIPFYNYDYGTGHVIHNGQHIWDGQPIDERMAGLFLLFPNQLTA